jgi:hypothetical protein
MDQWKIYMNEKMKTKIDSHWQKHINLKDRRGMSRHFSGYAHMHYSCGFSDCYNILLADIKKLIELHRTSGRYNSSAEDANNLIKEMTAKYATDEGQ